MSKMLKIKRLHEDAIMPTRAHSSDSGLDLYAPETHVIASGEVRVIPIGLAMEVPEGYEIQIRPRSGLSKKGIMVILGTVDAGYRGEVCVTMINATERKFVVGWGIRIAQAVINKIELWTPVECDSLSETDRGGKGFGSTGV